MKRYAYDGLQLFSFSSQSWDTRFSVGSRMLMRRCNTRKLRNFLNMQSELARDTFENWQSEFLQLMWQVMGLAYFLYVGSPSSKENDDRLEAKIDELLKNKRR
ncbi:DUF6766 family protein (plasmid) [Rhizobium sp. T1470]|uniref:DUF6766 family protein n=1 Tax=unclassified Rhizobium TaxID=2613769 RepID=UPI001CD32AE5|nr:DUF6766 family protein [Rhizobium sp. T1473]MCA0806897.1 hypothetical protein [Rhizobium sp. T1473]